MGNFTCKGKITMDKALKILNEIRWSNNADAYIANISGICIVHEAIAELEALQQRRCDGCKLCDGNYCEFLEITINSGFFCNRYEKKEKL